MFPYIVCWCGRSIGDLFPLFNAMKQEKYEEYCKKNGIVIEPKRVTVSSDVHVDVGDILDALHLHTDCCRSRMITQIEFKEYY